MDLCALGNTLRDTFRESERPGTAANDGRFRLTRAMQAATATIEERNFLKFTQTLQHQSGDPRE